MHLDAAYHGETLGALAVSDVGLYKDTYRPLLLEALQTPAPDVRRPDRAADIAGCLEALDRLLQERGTQIGALILEPLLQCAAGMRMHEAEFVRGVAQRCAAHGVHLIADEIAVGFGRTGTLFACEQAGITPDFLCLSKGITGGFLPLAVVLTRNEVYADFYADWAEQKAFLHSHSYTGNPLACAAANATLDLFEARDVLGRNRALGARMEARLRAAVEDHPHVTGIRRHGLVLACDLVAQREPRVDFPAAQRRGLRAYRYGLEHEALLRPLGHTMYLMPPYVLSDAQADTLIDTLVGGIEAAVSGPA